MLISEMIKFLGRNLNEAQVPERGQIVVFKGEHYKVERDYPTKDDAKGPLATTFTKLIKKGGGAVIAELKGERYVIFFKSSGEQDGAPVWLKPAQYKRAMSYKWP